MSLGQILVHQKQLKPKRHLLLLKSNPIAQMVSWGTISPLLLLVFCFFSFAHPLWAKIELEVRNKSYFSTRDFKRIPEFFSGQEYEGWKVYCRSDRNHRDGFYFVVKVNGSDQGLSENAYWVLDWITSLDPVAQTVKIPIENPKIFGKEVFIGLTGDDWPDKSVQPLAWRLRLMDGKDALIAKSQSFLW